jgi:hypothetical protein
MTTRAAPVNPADAEHRAALAVHRYIDAELAAGRIAGPVEIAEALGLDLGFVLVVLSLAESGGSTAAREARCPPRQPAKDGAA